MKSYKNSANRNAARVTLLPETGEALKALAQAEGLSISALVSRLILEADVYTKPTKVQMMCITPEADEKLRKMSDELNTRKSDILRRIITEAIS